MGSLKEKLYNFVVRKNEMIRYEYETYVQQNLSEHYENRSKHWKFLLKLNWHYRVLKKTTPCMFSKPIAKGKDAKKEKNKNTVSTKKNTVQPVMNGVYTAGPESELAKRPDPYHFVKVLLKYDVVSFDVFDTLVFRPFHNPTDLFNIIGKRLEFPSIFTSFKQGRIDAEKEARSQLEKEYGTREINIYDIYELIEKKFNIPADKGVETEIATEEDYLLPNPYMKVVFNILRSQGKEIVLTSDMYIPGEIMERMLKNVGMRVMRNFMCPVTTVAIK